MPVDENGFDTTYKGVIIQGSHFAGQSYNFNLNIVFSKEMQNEYIPLVNKLFPNINIGLRLFMYAHTHMEGFYPGSKAYSTHNPGNIGNTDGGKVSPFANLELGIIGQENFIREVAAGKRPKSFPLGKDYTIKPTFSKEIAKNPDRYKKSPWIPGYHFIYTGQLDQYIKIYATAPRSGNNYINVFGSLYKQHGFSINPSSYIHDLIALK